MSQGYEKKRSAAQAFALVLAFAVAIAQTPPSAFVSAATAAVIPAVIPASAAAASSAATAASAAAASSAAVASNVTDIADQKVAVGASAVYPKDVLGHWSYKYVGQMSSAAIIDGGSSEGFRPDDFLSREECAVIISRLASLVNGSPAPKVVDENAPVSAEVMAEYADGDGISFNDVKPNRWSYEFVEAVKQYMPGDHLSGGGWVFRPEQYAKRGDLAMALMMLSGKRLSADAGLLLSGFKDSQDIRGPWRTYAALAVQEKVLVGSDDGELLIDDPVTRAEACAVAIRALEGVVEFPAPGPDIVFAPDLDSGFYDAFYDEAVFVGDSVTMGLRNYVMAARSKGSRVLGSARFLTAGSYGLRAASGNFNPNGVNLTYQGVAAPLEDCLNKMNAKDIYLMLGMNDWAGAALPGSIEMYGAIIDKVASKNAGSVIRVELCTPITKDGEKTKLNNANMDLFNEAILTMCEARGLDALDINSPLKDETGALRREYSSDNYVHMSYAGCEAWIGALREFARDKYVSGEWTASGSDPEGFEGEYWVSPASSLQTAGS